MRLALYSERSGAVVDLSAFHTRPQKALEWGGGPRAEVTRYGGINATSAQILGEELDDVSFEAVLDDMQADRPGLAQATLAALEALRDEYGLVRLEYENERWWGLLSVKRAEQRRDRVTYTVKLQVLYRVPPDSVVAPALAPQPLDLSGALDDALSQVSALASSPPAEVSPSLAVQALLEIRAAQNAISEVLGVVTVVEYYAQLGTVEARRLMSLGLTALASLARAADKVANTSLDAASVVVGAPAVLCALWQSNTELALRKTSVTVRALVTGLAAVAVPTSAKTHLVRQGETLMSVARQQYGSVALWTRIADANPGVAMVPDAGATLIIPEVL